jgi:Carboxypeptidase regulatory-like domain
MPLEVADRHIDGVAITLTTGGGELSGKLTMPGTFDVRNMTVELDRVDFQVMDSPNAKVAEDGKFSLKNIFAGRYGVRVTGLAENSYVKSVKLGNQELDQNGADLSGADLSKGGTGLEILISRSGAQVAGTVMGQDDRPMSGATVTLIPESGRESSYRSMSADADGTFTMKGLPPGKYAILAWEDVEPGAYQDAEYVKPFNGLSQALVLEENAKAKVTLKAVPFDKLSSTMYAKGKRQFLPLGTGVTNDLGEYRIANLAAGRYLLSAARMNLNAAPVPKPAGDEPEQVYITTYYPNATEATGAAPVDSHAGSGGWRDGHPYGQSQVSADQGKSAGRARRPDSDRKADCQGCGRAGHDYGPQRQHQEDRWLIRNCGCNSRDLHAAGRRSERHESHGRRNPGSRDRPAFGRCGDGDRSRRGIDGHSDSGEE